MNQLEQLHLQRKELQKKAPQSSDICLVLKKREEIEEDVASSCPTTSTSISLGRAPTCLIYSGTMHNEINSFHDCCENMLCKNKHPHNDFHGF